jgi:Fur family ferric uptake transcriptional regulator
MGKKTREGAPSELLRAAGLRRTAGRIALLQALLSSRRPITHDELMTRVGRRRFDRVTVYRSLQAFVETGLLHRIETGRRLWRFAFCGCGSRVHCHPHFTCRSCGTVECLSDVELPHVAAARPHYVVDEQEVYMRGVCAKCSSRSRQ